MTREQIETELKKVNQRIKSESDRLRSTKANIEKYSNMKASFEASLSEMDEPEKKQPHFTIHAILRYFERVKGYDLKAIEREILPEAFWDIATSGLRSLPITVDGEYSHTVKLTNGTVTTIYKTQSEQGAA